MGQRPENKNQRRVYCWAMKKPIPSKPDRKSAQTKAQRALSEAKQRDGNKRIEKRSLK